MTVEDFISRRSRIAFLDTISTDAALPRIGESLSKVRSTMGGGSWACTRARAQGSGV